MTPVEQLLRERIGLDPASVGATLIERTVRLRMTALRLPDVAAYMDVLHSSAAEWEELVESVVVGETWFFRDREPFAALVRLVLLDWLPGRAGTPLRLLSVPCSSGEEPYSMAMALLEAGLPPDRFRIDALDISRRALARARRGVYGRNSFRGADLAFRERHFRPTPEGYAVLPVVRRTVHFRHGNILSGDFLADQPPYDFIFCRNLLIYFDPPAQQRALAVLDRLLAENGFLFVGPAELPLVVQNGYLSTNLPMAFVCRRAGPQQVPGTARSYRAAGPSRPPPEVLRPASGAGALRPSRGAICDRGGGPTRPAGTEAGQATDLQRAGQLADAGRLEEAAALCREHLRRRGDSAQAYYLLGLIHDARGEAAAADYYRKALYLEPNHRDALLHMALLHAQQGDLARARAFKRRAQRARNSALGPPSPEHSEFLSSR